MELNTRQATERLKDPILIVDVFFVFVFNVSEKRTCEEEDHPVCLSANCVRTVLI